MKEVKRSFILDLTVSQYDQVYDLIDKMKSGLRGLGIDKIEHVTENRLKSRLGEIVSKREEEAEQVKIKIQEKLRPRLIPDFIPASAELAKIKSVGKVTEIPVQRAWGASDSSERLLVKAETHVWDPILEDYVPEDRIYSFWDERAQQAAKELQDGGYLYIKDLSVSKRKDESGQVEMIFRSVKAFKQIGREMFERIKLAFAENAKAN